MELRRQRILTQGIGSHFDSPLEVVSALGAVQAQDYLGALWAVGLRTRGAVETSVELALANRSIIRTWPMRGTLHLVAAEDARWMLRLLTPRVVARNASRLKRDYGLDGKALQRCAKVLSRVLEREKQLTRNEVYQWLESSGIGTGAQRGLHILLVLAQDGLICFGPRRGKQPTFVLLEDWIPAQPTVGSRDESLARIALRYFTGHGPATISDFAWWSGLSAADARSGHSHVASQLETETIGGIAYHFSPRYSSAESGLSSAHLLPAFDEYLVGYSDRRAALDPKHENRLNVLLGQTMIIDGRVVGTWKRVLARHEVAINAVPFSRLSKAESGSIAAAAERYRSFLAKHEKSLTIGRCE